MQTGRKVIGCEERDLPVASLGDDSKLLDMVMDSILGKQATLHMDAWNSQH